MSDPPDARVLIEQATTARLESDPPPADSDAPESDRPVRASAPEKRKKSDPPPPPPPRTSAAAAAPADLPPVPRGSAAPKVPRVGGNDAKKTSSTHPDAIGRTLDGRYRIEERLGVGGVGAVYLGTQLALGRSVAIKLLHEGLDPSFRTRFEREAKALAALRHPNIVSVTDYGVDGTTPYLVMEKLEGETLGERLTRGPLLPEHVLELTRQLLRALGFVHEQGLVHRDLKPGNLFLELTPDGDERLKLLDFGLAKFVQEPGVEGQTVTRAGHVVGTPAYMAPEQIAGDAVDARSDIYAVGVLLFQALSGKVPFEGEPMEQLKGHLVAAVPPLTTAAAGMKPRPELAALVARALEKRRENRYGSALEMLVALEAVPQPWLLEAALLDDAAAADSESAKTAVHQAAAKRHARAQRGSRWPGVLLLLALVALGMILAQRLRAPGLAGGENEGSRAQTAVPADPTSEPAAEPSKPGEPDMVIAVPEGTGEQAAGEPAAAAEAAGAEGSATTEVAAEGPAGEAVAGSGAIAPVATAEAAAAEEAAKPATGTPAGWRNPWTRDTPAALRQIRKAVMEGERGNDRMIAVLRKYNRGAADKDPRGHLLLARMYLNRGWREDALSQFQIAYNIDPSSRGAPKMLGDLLSLVAYGKTSRDASRFVREAYGAEAVREIDRALLAFKDDAAAVARLKSLRAAVSGA